MKFPFDEGNIRTLITSNPDIYNNHSAQNITRLFEVGAGFFMAQGGKKNYVSSFDYTRYKDLIEGVIYPRSFYNISKGKYTRTCTLNMHIDQQSCHYNCNIVMSPLIENRLFHR